MIFTLSAHLSEKPQLISDKYGLKNAQNVFDYLTIVLAVRQYC